MFSLGTVVNSTNMPTEWRAAFASAFSRLHTYQIYWLTTEPEEDESEMPSNVNRTLFIPQIDLLAADETRLLITNGGMDSLMEAALYGVPVLGIPLYGSNYANLRKAEHRGMARILDKDHITEQSVYEALTDVLERKSFRQAAVKISRAIKDRPLTPYESLIYWVELVGRNRGAPFLARGAPLPSFLALLFLDLPLAVLAALYLLYVVAKRLSRLVFGKAPLPSSPAVSNPVKRKPESKKKKAVKSE